MRRIRTGDPGYGLAMRTPVVWIDLLFVDDSGPTVSIDFVIGAGSPTTTLTPVRPGNPFHLRVAPASSRRRSLKLLRAWAESPDPVGVTSSDRPEEPSRLILSRHSVTVAVDVSV